MFRVVSTQLRARLTTIGVASIVCGALAFGEAFAQQVTTSVRADTDSTATASQVNELKALVEKLQLRVNDLEEKARTAEQSSSATAVAPVATSNPASGASSGGDKLAAVSAAPQSDQNILRGTTVNFLFDGYYGYNFNDPIGRVNLLRAYDVSSNAFSLNQAGLVIENAPDLANGRRYGLRLDLQYGQATAALQGNASNEPRPDVYRNIFQAYGTYILPIGSGLTVDFGKWASSLGAEGNYTKDQMNYSRSFWFSFLPFYHMGARLNYKVNDALSLNYWITNGTQQTEPFNGFKDQLFG
jgi:hypothetical protein